MNNPHLVRKTTDPVAAPPEAGIHWVNTSNGKEFFSTGTATVADWVERSTVTSIAWGSITGTLSSQSDLNTALGLKADASALTTHTSNTSNPHSVTKAQVGLGSVDNTSDAGKPVSTAQQTALDLKANIADLSDLAFSGDASDINFNGDIILAEGSKFGWTETATDTYITSPTDGRIDFYTNGVNSFYINPSQESYFPAGPLSAQSVLTSNVKTSGGNPSIEVDGRRLRDSANTAVMDWENKTLNGPWQTDDNFSVNGDLSVGDGLINITKDDLTTDSGGHNHIYEELNIKPTEDSPTTTWIARNSVINIDPDASGYDIGTGGNLSVGYSVNFNHGGTSDIGGVTAISSFMNIGNNTDEIDVNGINIFNAYSNVQKTNLLGQVNGFGFMIAIDSDSTMGQNTNPFYDQSNIQCPSNGHYSFTSSPQIAEIKNNANFQSFICNPNVPIFTGNSNFNGMSITPTLGTFDTGQFFGINVNPTVAAVDYGYGIYVNMNNVTVNNDKWAGYFEGDVQINGSLGFSGALSTGQFNSFGSFSPIDGGGNPQTGNSAISQYVFPANDTTANADFIGMNTAMLLGVGANATPTFGAFGLNAALALPMVIETHTGSILPEVQGGTFALSYSGGSTGGTINRAAAGRFVGIPNGITTTDRFYGVWSHQPFGQVGTDNWGVYSEDSSDNYFEGNVKIGGTAGTNDKAAATFKFHVEGDSKFEGLTGFYGAVETNGTLTFNNDVIAGPINDSGNNPSIQVDQRKLKSSDNTVQLNWDNSGTVVIPVNLEVTTGVGFYGTSAVAQQTSSGPQTAGALYTSTEQTMIQEMYDALRAYGLLS